ncbi:MAG TPA: hypothetical protein PKK00_03405 [Bacteroidales bacterium]|nr:hypothetical protein [Bacteroidales bacterium]HPS16458.1 hypothetical protein [Bacteroidales bacterium]
MKNKNSSFLQLLFFFISGILQSQTLISSSGGFYSSTNTMLSFTVAQMTMVQTFSTTNNILTQGFQQPEDLTTDIIENPIISENVMVYPNRTSGVFKLIYTSSVSGKNKMILYYIVGQIVYVKEITQNIGVNNLNIDNSNFRQGVFS